MTLKEQLLASSICYLVQLNSPKDAASAVRYSVYCSYNNTLNILWPSHEESLDELRKIEMVHTGMRIYPAYHFIAKGYGYDKRHQIADTLRRYCHRPDLKFYELNGYSPSLICW